MNTALLLELVDDLKDCLLSAEVDEQHVKKLVKNFFDEVFRDENDSYHKNVKNPSSENNKKQQLAIIDRLEDVSSKVLDGRSVMTVNIVFGRSFSEANELTIHATKTNERQIVEGVEHFLQQILPHLPH